MTGNDEASGDITVMRNAWTDSDTLDKNGRPHHYAEVEITGLRQDQFMACKVLDKEGDGMVSGHHALTHVYYPFYSTLTNHLVRENKRG